MHLSFSVIFSLSVNFKKNEKVYNPEKSEVLKALQENDSEPEPGNEKEMILYLMSQRIIATVMEHYLFAENDKLID